jgi:hypothetical protein
MVVYDLLMWASTPLLLMLCCVLIRDWSFVPRLLLTVFLCFNPCRTIQILHFCMILHSQTHGLDNSRFFRGMTLFRHVWSTVPNPAAYSDISTEPLTKFFIPVSPIRCIAAKMIDRRGNSWGVIANRAHSFLLWPAIGVFYVYIATAICIPILCPRSPIKLLLTHSISRPFE